ncbi:MAG: TIGR04283 family arsenosugar biosynthesis glycosyltransferase [Hyphomicrobiaceae bacterium]
MRGVSVIIPALDAACCLQMCLDAVAGVEAVIVADGGSLDATIEVARAFGASVVSAPRGRGPQLCAGVAAASSEWLLFLHADTVLEPSWRGDVEAFIGDAGNARRAAVFRFALDDPSVQARRLEQMVAWRGRALGLPYGDQGLLISRALYHELGGYAPLVLMEDVDIVRRIGRARLTVLPSRAVTSAAKWQRDGWMARSARNLTCLGLYYAGVPPRFIQRVYGA